jgi:O-succinylbenzoic acid--CoA ligase
MGVITPTVRSTLMAGQSRTLVAILLPRPEAARAVVASWDRGDAVAVLDPSAPKPVLETLLGVVAPNVVLDPDGRRPHNGAAPNSPKLCAVVTTSGTTDTPKAVELTIAGRDAIGKGFETALGAEPDDHWLVCLPLHHVAGLAILARARTSGAAVTVHPGFDLMGVANAPQEIGATLVSLVPTMLHRLLEAHAPLHEYRRIVVGGAAMSPALRARAEAAGAPVVDAYGMSETWGGIAVDGVAIPGVEIALSSDAGAESEVLVRGDAVMRGYRGRTGENPFTPDGFFRTGDIGTLHRGRLHIIDRARDFVISGGVNVSPSAVEAVLADHESLADVCVAGVPDPEWGERVVAYVVVREHAAPPTADELRDYARDRLAAAQLPKEVVVLDAIPRTAGGKARRRELPTPR